MIRPDALPPDPPITLADTPPPAPARTTTPAQLRAGAAHTGLHGPAVVALGVWWQRGALWLQALLPRHPPAALQCGSPPV